MPQIELKYSNNLEIDVRKIFESVEKIINKIDSSAGLCKSRAFPIKEFLHSHAFLTVSVLKKAHRDDVFMEKLLQALEHNLKQHNYSSPRKRT